MPWLPVMILLVFGMVSIAYMVQVPEERNYNTPRLIRREPVVEVEPVKEDDQPNLPNTSIYN